MKKNRTLNFISSSALVLLMVFGVACAKKDGGNSAPPPPPPPAGIAPNCAGCGVIGAGGILGTVRGISPLGDIEIAADLYGDATKFNPADPKAIIYYNGPVAMKANLRIMRENACRALVGDYMVETIQPGIFSSSMINNLRLTAVGPNGGRIELSMIRGILYNSMDPNGLNLNSRSNMIYTELRFDMVNGQPCGLIYSTASQPYGF
jgi:hypothetical protein